MRQGIGRSIVKKGHKGYPRVFKHQQVNSWSYVIAWLILPGATRMIRSWRFTIHQG